MPGVGQGRAALGVLHAIQRPLLTSTVSLFRQLAALGQRCCGGSSGAGSSHLPTAAQLQAAWAVLVMEAGPGGMREGLPRAELSRFTEQAARILQALQPDSPRSSLAMGEAAASNAIVHATSGSGPPLRDPQPHLRRSAELARAQGSDFWLARWARRVQGVRSGQLLAA